MQIAYLYNEKLPKKTAHDVYIWRNVYFLSQFSQASEPGHPFKVTYITGQSRPRVSMETLQNHYLPSRHHFSSEVELISSQPSFWNSFFKLSSSTSHQIGSFTWIEMPLWRKSGPFRLSWNLPFFHRCQRWIQTHQPEWVLMSVYKQASYHLKHRVQGVRYLFEVHDLAYYPEFNSQSTLQSTSQDLLTPKKQETIEIQKKTLEACDCITVTTEELKAALLNNPYNIKKPIYVVPLASEMEPLLPAHSHNTVKLGYVGQLYPDQGVDVLVQALAHVEGLELEVIGGNPTDLERLQNLVYQLKLNDRVRFHGFVSPQALSSRLYGVDALVAPFYPTTHMRHVAHTKLVDYGRWALPVIAPDLPITRQEVRSDHFLFEASSYPKTLDSLIQTLHRVKDRKELQKAQEEIEKDKVLHPTRFSWQERSQKLASILQNPQNALNEVLTNPPRNT